VSDQLPPGVVRESLARRTAVADIEQATAAALDALTDLRDALARAERIMPGRQVSEYCGISDGTRRRWKLDGVPPSAALRRALAHMAGQPILGA